FLPRTGERFFAENEFGTVRHARSQHFGMEHIWGSDTHDIRSRSVEHSGIVLEGGNTVFGSYCLPDMRVWLGDTGYPKRPRKRERAEMCVHACASFSVAVYNPDITTADNTHTVRCGLVYLAHPSSIALARMCRFSSNRLGFSRRYATTSRARNS